MNDDADDPDLIDVLRTAIAAGLGRVRVAIPATVVSYDATKQTITAQVAIRSRYIGTDKQPIAYLPAPIANVPVDFPSGGGYAITWPLSAGDPVVLVICDRSIDEWKTTAAADNAPAIPRRFDLSDAIAIPGGRSPADALGANSVADAMVITLPATKTLLVGADTATDGVARDSLVASVLGTLKTWLDAHVHTSAATGAPTSPPIVPSPTAASTASARLKVDG